LINTMASTVATSVEEAYFQAVREYRFVLNDDRPCSLQDCYDKDGFLISSKYEDYLTKEDELEEAERNRFYCAVDWIEEEERPFQSKKLRKKQR